MRIPYSWLKEFLQADIPAEELAEVLTMGGLEVEEIEEWSSADGQARDQILITKVTANRGDLLSIVGVARQAAALLGTSYKKPDFPPDILREVLSGGLKVSDSRVTIELADPQGCPRYSGVLIEGVRLAPSPPWMAYRLEAAGMRPLINVVDCTNYVMLEWGQPLHAFDYELLHQGHIIVRRAEEGEPLQTLDEQWRTLCAEDLVIADPRGAVALAGVMGGANSEINERSTRVLLESAHFDPTSIRKTSLRLGLSTEASYRFERHVDPNGTLPALARVTQLILQTAGGHVASRALDARAENFAPRQITLRPARCNAILGMNLSVAEMQRCLEALDFAVEKTPAATDESGYVLQVSVPRLRWDIEREIDLIEEIAIVHGYDKLPATVPGKLAQAGLLSQRQRLVRQVGAVLRQGGLNEMLSFSFSSPAELDRLGYPADAPERNMLALSNPMNEAQSHMRTTLLPALLEAAAHNVRQRVRRVALYEINKVFLPKPGELLPAEPLRVAGLLMGSVLTANWNAPEALTQPDFFWLKGLVEQLCASLGLTNCHFARKQHPVFHPGRCAALFVASQEAGVLGEIAPQIQQAYELPERAYAFELDLELLLDKACDFKPYQPLPRFPPVRRDVAIVAPEDDEHAAARLEQIIRRAGGDILQHVELFDVFVDAERLGPGNRNLAYSLEFRAPDRTLTDEEVDAAMARICESIAQETKGRIRDF